MAQMTSRSFVQKDVIGRFLSKSIKNMAGGKLIYGSISVAPGHDYWWFLEYGTGPFYSRKDRALNPPASVVGKRPEGRPYTIKPKRSHGILVYMFQGSRKRSKTPVVHPGIQPLGFVRTSLFEARLDLKKEIEREIKLRTRRKRSLTSRDDLVEIVNEVLIDLQRRLALRTPDDEDIDPYHEHRPHTPPLSESWEVNLAK